MFHNNSVKILKILVLVLFVLVSIFTIYSKYSTNIYPIPKVLNEQFNEPLLSINSQKKLDSLINNKFKNFGYDTAKTVVYIDQFIRNRFYHTYSVLTFKENWIAYLSGKLFWEDFYFPISSKDIIKFPMAACSQQGIIFQHQLNLLKIPCRTIEFKPNPKNNSGHYAVSVYYNSSWHFYDSDQEPIIIDSLMPSIEKIIELKLYKKMYIKETNINSQHFFENKIFYTINNKVYGKGNMYYFQLVTGFLSNWLWLLFLICFILLIFKRKIQ